MPEATRAAPPDADRPLALATDGLTRRFGAVRAVDKLGLAVQQGTIGTGRYRYAVSAFLRLVTPGNRSVAVRTDLPSSRE